MNVSPALWAIIQQFGRQGVNFAIFLLLATWLEPHAFGILSTALLWIAFMVVFSEPGFNAALIQKRTLEPGDLSSVFFLNIGLGIILCLIGIAGSWSFASFIGTPEAQPVIAVLSLAFITDSLSFTQIALAQRELRFRDLAIRDIGAALAGGIVGILLALQGYGVWSLVAQILVTSISEVALLWRFSPWRPQLRDFSLQRVRDMWNYSSKIFAFSLFKYVAQNADKFLISFLLGPLVLGIYTFAFRLVVFPVNTFIGAIGTYLFPKFALQQAQPDSLRSSYLLIIRVSTIVVAPAVVIMAFLAPSAIPLLFGEQWRSAIMLVQLFAPVAILQTFISPSGPLMKALNHPDWLLWWTVLFTVIILLCIWIGSASGTFGVGVGSVVAYLLAVPLTHRINAKLIGVNATMMLQALLPAVVASLVVGAFLGFGAKGITHDYWGISLRLIISLLAYLVVLVWMERTSALRVYRKWLKI